MIMQILAAAALIGAQAPAAAPPACVTREQAADMLLIQLPEAVNVVAQQCSASLPATAFLRSGAPAWIERLRGEGASRRASALAAFSRLSAGRVPAGVSPEVAMSAMASGMLTQFLSGRINAATCTETSRFLEALSALPGTNFAAMVSSGLGIAFALRQAQATAASPAPQTYEPLCAQ